MIDDGTLFRLGQDKFRWIGGDDYGGIWLKEQAKALGLNVQVKPATDQIHNLAVQGPRSREILREVVWTPPGRPSVDELGWFRFTVGRIGGFEGIPDRGLAHGLHGRAGLRGLFATPRTAGAVWDAIMQAGEPFGIAPMGLAALDMVRIEAGLVFAGNEFDSTTDPFEAGIGFAVARRRTRTWIGQEALARRKAHPKERLVGLELEGNEAAGNGDPVFVGRAQIGMVTSATRSPVLKKNLALARLDVAHADLDGEVEDRQARRAAEATARNGGPVPVLRPGEDPPEVLAVATEVAPRPSSASPTSRSSRSGATGSSSSRRA